MRLNNFNKNILHLDLVDKIVLYALVVQITIISWFLFVLNFCSCSNVWSDIKLYGFDESFRTIKWLRRNAEDFKDIKYFFEFIFCFEERIIYNMYDAIEIKVFLCYTFYNL